MILCLLIFSTPTIGMESYGHNNRLCVSGIDSKDLNKYVAEIEKTISHC